MLESQYYNYQRMCCLPICILKDSSRKSFHFVPKISQLVCKRKGTYKIAKLEPKSEVLRELLHVVQAVNLLVRILDVEIVDFFLK